MLARFAAFQACHDLDAKVEGTIRIAFTIDRDGQVADARLAESMNAPVIESCALKLFWDMKFPAADKPTKVTFPLQFRQSRDQDSAP